MTYKVKRGEQEFGPYSLTELSEYAGTGNVLASDLARSDGMAEWITVERVLGNVPVPIAARAPVEARVVAKLPPNLHWLLVLLITAITQGIFSLVWGLILANWARKMTGNNKPLVLIAMYPAGVIATVIAAALGFKGMLGVCMVAGLIMYVWGTFSIKEAMEEHYNSKEKIGLILSGPMTLFFSVIYLQYHVNRLHKWKDTGVLA